MLFKTNYRIWVMNMEVVIFEETMTVLDAKKTIKENWEILQSQNLGVDRVIQSWIQGLKCGYEILTMDK
ncbi:unnamed protein product [Spirodela intermedia]|uniref:Uncharacterized protein n=1 Tax=Spirodela intermedia TaxID=51605 RepID=A0A7I8K9M3_SPIIN|nr:unnamed protein product [Spirodela intermedia]